MSSRNVGADSLSNSGPVSRRLWAAPLIGALGAATVLSPVTGSIIGVCLIAGLCALGLASLSRFGFDIDVTRKSGGVATLTATAIVTVGLIVCSVFSATTGLLWICWSASVAAFVLITSGMWLTSKRAS